MLVWAAHGKGHVFWLYLSALLFMAAGATTGFFNQPINALVIG